MKTSACDHNACSVNKKYHSFVKSADYMRIKPELIFLTHVHIPICMKVKGDHVFCTCSMCLGLCMLCSAMQNYFAC